MTIAGEDLGKKYGKNWVFRNININISEGESLAITGSNGSGKSTLLKILSGYLSPSEGVIKHNEKKIDVDDFELISFSAPYVEVPEEMTFDEFLRFNTTFRVKCFSNEEISRKATLPLNKRIGEFSTGMKQRVQLSTAFYFQNQAIFMDEPTSNLDNEGFEWWKEEIKGRGKVSFILASNQKNEIGMCQTPISL